MEDVFRKIKGGVVVSCQALENEPLHSSFIMGKMALAAMQGGAVGIRANTVKDIKEIKENVSLPIIGIIKKEYTDSKVYITPTITEVAALIEVNIDIIAIDATDRVRPQGEKLENLIEKIKQKWPKQLLMADIASKEEAKKAQTIGFDCIGTTLYGYTDKTQGKKLFDDDFAFLKEVLSVVTCPVVAEGNILVPEAVKRVLELGAYTVVVGGAITRPQQITARFCSVLKK